MLTSGGTNITENDNVQNEDSNKDYKEAGIFSAKIITAITAIAFIIAVFYILTVPVICAFLGSFVGNHIIYPFITSIICEGFIIKTRLFKGDLNKGLWMTSLISLIILGVSYVFIR